MKLSIPKDPIKRAVALSVYGERMEAPLVITSLLFLVAYSWQVIGQPTGMEQQISELLMGLTWVVFSVDFIITMALTENRKRFTPLNVVHMLAVILPAFRLLRLIRVVSILKVINRSAVGAFKGKVMAYVVTSASLVTYMGALAALDAERFVEESKITNFGDALWWAFVTITTVGYGDHFPITLEGRLIAAVLMVAGISLLGIVTATMGVWILSVLDEIRKEELHDEKKDALDRELGAIDKTRDELLAQLEELDKRETELKQEAKTRQAEESESAKV